MNVTILPGTLKGAVTPPSSKSQTHRAVLALMLAQGEGKLSNLAVSEDIQATQDCVAALKSGHPAQADGLPLLDCGESGSTLRFLIPVALAVRGGGHFIGRGRLMERPQGPYIRLFEEKGILWKQEGACLTVAGQLEPGVYALPGNVSSQFITGLLYALPLLPGDSRIVLTTPLESRGYVDMTLDMLRRFDIKVEEQEDGFLVPGNQTYQARDLTLEADWSGAAFWYAANFLGAQVDIQGLNPDSVQGDRQIGTLYWKLARPGDVDIDLSQCPDLAPPLAAMAAVRKGTTRFVHAGRLRMKESDRLETIARTLNALGAKAQVGEDTLTLEGLDHLKGGTVDGCNDHRIAMMAAVTAVACKEPVIILGAECVKKSYPRFWEDYTALGGEVHGLISG